VFPVSSRCSLRIGLVPMLQVGLEKAQSRERERERVLQLLKGIREALLMKVV
jgi:hypothetical protein